MCTSKPKISIIVPVYNTYNYLDRCLKSIINQTFRHLEIIIINDGSTDNSAKILNKYAKSDNRIRLFYQKNQGLSQTRNNGIKLSTCKYIAFADSDDELPLDALEIQYKTAIKNKSDLVVGDIMYVGKNYKNLKQMNNHKDNLKAVLEKRIALSSCCKLYKKTLFTKNNLYFTQNKLYEDRDFTIKLFHYTKKVAFSRSLSYIYYYQRDDSISNDIKIKNIEDAFWILKDIFYFLQNKNIYKRYKFTFFYFTIFLLQELMLASSKKQFLINEFIKNLQSSIFFIDKDISKNIFLKNKNTYIVFIFLLFNFIKKNKLTFKQTKKQIPLYLEPKIFKHIHSRINKNNYNDLVFFIFDFLKNNDIKQVIIYGAGSIFANLEKKLKKTNIKILYIIDKKAEVKEFNFKNYKVRQKSNLINLYANIPIVIASFAYADEIIKDLEIYKKENGLKNEIYDLHRCLNNQQ